jgi:hypothetical protein
MTPQNALRPATDCTVNRARKFSGIGNAQTSKPNTTKSQAPLRADLNGSDTCSAADITSRGHAPVLVLCRELIATGCDPDRAMEVFRGATLALHIRSISAAAALTVKAAGNGSPIFAPLEGAAGSAIRHSISGPLGTALDLIATTQDRGGRIV